MGTDKNKVTNFMMCPINPDGSTVELNGLELSTDSPDNSMYKDSIKFLSSTISVTLKCNLPRKMSRKKFKKWLMSRGFNRYFAEWFCKVVKSFHGKKSYQSLYLYGRLTSTPQALFNALFDALFPIYKIKGD